LWCERLQQKRQKCSASSGHITKVEQSRFSLDIYDLLSWKGYSIFLANGQSPISIFELKKTKKTFLERQESIFGKKIF